MTGLFLSVICLYGYVYFAWRYLKIPIEQAPFFSISLIGVALFFFAVFNQLETGAFLVLGVGTGACAGSAVSYFKNKKIRWFCPLGYLFIFLLVFSFIITLAMRFTTIDDYVYWGIMGKYLYLTDHLPTPDTTIIRRHLSYTPGTSLIHYLFYRIFGGYRPAISYFAQNIILLSALFVVIKDRQIRKGIVLFVICAVFTGLFFGSIFTKLQVDYLLSVFFFAILWIYFRQAPTMRNLLPLSMPIAFLYLIKEVGFALSLLLMIIIILDLLLKNELAYRDRLRMMAAVAAMAFFVFFIKNIWQSHCQAMGFAGFSGQINMETIAASLNIWGNDQSRQGFLIFLKTLFFGESDRLNLPYILWYGIVAFLWIKILKISQLHDRERIVLLLKTLFAAFFVFAAMNYFMQLIVFNVGDGLLQTAGLERYLNILFVPIVLFSLLYYLDAHFFKTAVSTKQIVCFCLVFFLVTGFSRVETTLRREKHFLAAEQIAGRIQEQIQSSKNNQICVVPGENDNELWIQLLYYLLPDTVKKGAFPSRTKAVFLDNLEKYDYVFFNSVDEKFKQWTRSYADEPVQAQSFYRISLSGKTTKNSHLNLKLERLF